MTGKRRVESEKGLVGYSKEPDPNGAELRQSGPNEFDIMAPNPRELVNSIVTAHRKLAEETISDAGGDPSQWRLILASKNVADPSYCAAQMLRSLSKLERAMNLVSEKTDDEMVKFWSNEAIGAALVAGMDYCSLAVSSEETSIVARRKSIEGARFGADAKAKKSHTKDAKILAAFREKRKDGRLSAHGAHVALATEKEFKEEFNLSVSGIRKAIKRAEDRENSSENTSHQAGQIPKTTV